MNTATLERATITVARIIPAKDRGKSATIKDVDGRMFGIWPDKLGLVNEGGDYEIDFSETVKNGTTYRDIKALRQVAAPRAQAAERRSDPFVTSDEVRQARSLGAAATPTPSNEGLQRQNGNNYYRPTSPRDSERMFVCSTLNAFIQTGRIDCHKQMLTDCINELRAAYAETFGREDQR